MTVTPINSVRKKSVTAANAVQGGTGVVGITFMSGYSQPYLTPLLPELPPYWSYRRDYVLSLTPQADMHWANALSIAYSKFSSLSWTVDGDVPLRVKTAQELLNLAEGGQGWVDFSYRLLADYLTTDNGLFIEIVRATSGAGSKIIGLMQLDSLNCIRTGDPETPVIYYDRLGVYHEMKAHQVIFFADSPSPRDRWYGIGFCAASRAYEKVRLIAAIERSLYEKITGGKPDTMDFITGITDKQLKDITNSYNADRLNKGAIVFGGSVLTAFMSNENISHVRIPFAGLPEDFDIEKERREARLEYANAIGLDPQDLQPLSGGGLGNGQQSKVLAAKGHGKGLASFEKALVHRLNEDVFPDRTTFAFNEKDFEQEKAKAEIKNMHATFVDVLVKDGTLTTEQARQVLLDAEAIPEEFVQTDVTANVSMSDSDNSDLLAQYNDQNQQAVVDIRQAMVDQMATKEVARQLESATRLYQELLLG